MSDYICPFCVFESNNGDKFDKHVAQEHQFQDYKPTRKNRLQCPSCGTTGHFNPDMQGVEGLNSILCRNTQCDVELYVTERDYEYFPLVK